MNALHVVQVRAVEEKEGQRRPGPYNRAGLQFVPGWSEHVVSDEQLKTIEIDYWLEVRVLDLRVQAARKMDFAREAVKAAEDAEFDALTIRTKANELMAAATEALNAVSSEPALVDPPPVMPMRDAMLAAMPGPERARFDRLEAADKPAKTNGKEKK